MFKCEKCNKVSEPGVAPKKVVVETRAKTYVENGHVVGQGREIAKELKLCSGCAVSTKAA
jgi:hypothetical protein